MQVVFSAAAETDIILIAQFIAEDNPVRAKSFEAELLTACLLLGENPYAYPCLVGYSASGYGRRVFGQHLIIFLIKNDVVQIVRVLHGARDIETILP